jgi:hypothetical protein
MESLHSLAMSALMDMLAEHTEKYTRMLTEGGDRKEKENCRLMIAALQKEIEFRKQVFDENAIASSQPPAFE